MRVALLYGGMAGAVGLLALLGGLAVAGADDWAGAAVGAGVGAALQVAVFWGAVVVAGRGRLFAYGMGMLARLAAFGVTALVLVPALGGSGAVTLLTLVVVFFLTGLLEPLVFRLT